MEHADELFHVKQLIGRNRMSMDTSFQIAFYNDLNIFDQKKIDVFVCRCYQETAVSSIHLPELNVLSVSM